ncbi:MAG TPA: BglII/BstYI family type II restriction endonuclease [Candidatus Acidoferrales bacterium]|nr:BglII/BstYI family type II restriction endonuclease [Candidatus Acidoferrales bacterium]
MERSSHPALPDEIKRLYEVHEWRNAITVLSGSYPQEWRDILAVLSEFRLAKSHLVKDTASSGSPGDATAAAGGGNKSKVAKLLDEKFTNRGWAETSFDTNVTVTARRRLKGKKKRNSPSTEAFDSLAYDAPTHNVDCYKNHVALEVEWNNKNPFFDRDLNNFRLLFELRAIGVGVVITRCDDLQQLFESLIPKKDAKQRYGSTTTHMSKLLPLLRGGGGGGCPVLVFGIRPALYDQNS